KMQRDWIGKSHGARVRFGLQQPVAGESFIDVFTTRPDTLYGVTFLTVAPEHPIARAVAKNDPAVAAFLEKMAKKSDIDRTAEDAPKEGVATGLSVVHPLTQQAIPLWIGSFVLMGYGTGAVMGVPAHDERDFAFARQHGLSIRVVIQPNDLPALPDD